MKLKKEDVYVSLKGKSKEELTDLYNFLESVGEEQYREDLISFLVHSKDYETYNFKGSWTLGWYVNSRNKTEVTIDQLKEIIKPNLKTQLENIKKELKRIENLIMEENEPKSGDWCKFWDNDKSNACIGRLSYINDTCRYNYFLSESCYINCEKITNSELIKLLEDESK